MPNNNSNKRAKKRNSNRDNVQNKNTTNRKKTNPNEVNKKGKKKGINPKVKIALKILIIIILLACVVGAGIITAMFFGVFGDDFEITKDELVVGSSNTIVLDKSGKEIANLSTDEKRKVISLSEMPDYLPKAYIAIEDKRFYKHNGVDLKRTTGAIIGVVTGKDNGGGSTITQQLVKNITDDKQRSGIAGVLRKVKEWSKAVQVERMISKNQILELYLNIIFVGGNELHGVELGSIYYFNKSAKDLDLAECAFLAGINNSPNAYNPYDTSKDHSELIKKRTLTVLSEMKDQGLIENEEEYNAAVAKVEAGLTFSKGNTGGEAQYSYHTSATINQVITQIMEEKGISYDLAYNYVYGSGLTIYSTEDSTVQAAVEDEFSKTKYQVAGRAKNPDGTLQNEHTQAGMVIIDHTTGQVVAVGGELGSQYATGWNRGTQLKRQTGSSMKPIADIAPGLQEKVITAATIYDDKTTEFSVGASKYKPGNSNNSQLGYINIRTCIKVSHNIPMVKIMTELTPKKSLEYLNKMGLTNLNEKDDGILALAIGGMKTGISPLEMAGAYATIANDGVYITPTFYTKVVDTNGNTVLTSKQEKTRVISEQNAYITRSILQEPLTTGGTATYCKITGMETCAKTGSTDDYVDRWLCGMTPYYTAACWFGYDNNQEPMYVKGKGLVSVDGKNPAGALWSAIMKNIHKDLKNKNFTKPDGIVEKTVCKTTGCLATDTCTDKYTDIFTSDNLPEKCEGHGTQVICQVSNKVANEYCPTDSVKTVAYGRIIPKEKLGLWKTLNPSSTSNDKIEDICDVHKKPVEQPKKPEQNTTTNSTTGNTTSNTTTDDKNNSNKNNTGDKANNTVVKNNTADQNVTSH